jgi:integrase
MRRGEILSLTWANVDRAAKVIRLNKTKNGKRRLLAYGKSPELVAVIELQHEARTALGRESAALTPWMFHRGGEPVRDFRAAWANACKAAGVPGRLFHDLRRTAIRNMVRSGVADVVAMSISGHQTRSVFDRYNIVNEADIAEALGRVHLGHRLSHKSESASDDDAASR